MPMHTSRHTHACAHAHTYTLVHTHTCAQTQKRAQAHTPTQIFAEEYCNSDPGPDPSVEYSYLMGIEMAFMGFFICHPDLEDEQGFAKCYLQ